MNDAELASKIPLVRVFFRTRWVVVLVVVVVVAVLLVVVVLLLSLSGPEIDDMNDAELASKIPLVRVFFRTRWVVLLVMVVVVVVVVVLVLLVLLLVLVVAVVAV